MEVYCNVRIGLVFARKVKRLCGLFFRSINKTQNLREIRKVYNECFVFCGVFCENIREIPAKCEIRKVYSRPKKYYIVHTH